MHTGSTHRRPSIRDPRRVVCILLDGARHDVLRHLLDRGDLPNLARWVIEPGGLAVGTTVFPSTTGVAYIPILFGRYPRPANVPGIRWLDRAATAAARGACRCPMCRSARSNLMPTMLEALGVMIPDGLDGVAFSVLATPKGATV